jgi:hypothetical protein
MAVDIRDKPYLGYDDVIRLNFIRHPGTYVFRKHYSQGLRSHIMEVLGPDDVRTEREGIIIEGTRWYPRAKPVKMLRIFRTKFDILKEALEEIRTVKIIEKYLAPDHLAVSDEFIVDYFNGEGRDFILCGLQEYVEGELLDPWGIIDRSYLAERLSSAAVERQVASNKNTESLTQSLQKKAEEFISQVKKMILEANYVPDLAGVGNLLVIPGGNIKLVDINNISKVTFESTIPIDDKGYPVCDKSIEALSFLEQKLLDRPIDMKETIYGTFLDPGRMKEVRALEEKFRFSMKHGEHST